MANRMFTKSHKVRCTTAAEKLQAKSLPTQNSYTKQYMNARKGQNASKLLNQLYYKFDAKVENLLASGSIATSDLLTSILGCKAEDGSGAYTFKYAYLEKEILSKFVDPQNMGDTTDEDRWSAGLEKLMTTERRCASINAFGFEFRDPSGTCERVLHRARAIVADILGDIPRDIFARSSFSSGATTARRRIEGDPYFKYSQCKHLDVTPGAYNYAYALISATPLWCAAGAWGLLRETVGNDVFAVPKNTTEFRIASKESDMNGALQKAFGSWIRERLLLIGIDLNDQRPNQRYARYGSITGSLATIDSRSASNCVSRLLPIRMLPTEVSEILERLRSPYGTINDQYAKTSRLHKWECHSTMGNGYTFELESLLFYALAKASAEIALSQFDVENPLLDDTQHVVSVYGDDIICPVYAADLCVRTLTSLGFENNSDKTFIRGPFRESCGKHYYDGVDVSPFYIRRPIDSISRAIWLVNKLRQWSYDETTDSCDPSVFILWTDLRRLLIPKELLGGRQIESVTSVVSPHERRFCLVRKVERITIDGAAGLLRAWQYSGGTSQYVASPAVRWNFGYVKQVNFDDVFASSDDSQSNGFIVDPTCIARFSLIANLEHQLTHLSYFFPQEIENDLRSVTVYGHEHSVY